jgi:hypothetical protein
MTTAGVSLTCLYLAAAAYTGSLAFFLLKRKTPAGLFFVCGFILHTISEAGRGWFIGIFTPIGLFEGIFFLPWCLAFLTVVFSFLKNDRDLILSSVIPVLIFLVIALSYPKGVFPPSPNVQTIFSSLFFVFEGLAHACFILGAWFALWYLRRREEASFFDNLIVWGFIFYSVAQVTGAIWSYLGWASLFSWNNRHLQSAAIWCFYAAYLHLRFLSGKDTKRRAVFSLAGFLLLFGLSYLGHLNEINMTRLGG